MMRNDYRRSLILLRSNASGYSGHVRLERRTLMGTMYFLVQTPGDCPALRAALVGQGRGGGYYACALGELERDARGQAVLGYSFDPRDICGRELEQYQLIALSCAGDESCQVALFGNVCGHAELDWSGVRAALRALYGAPEGQQPPASASPAPQTPPGADESAPNGAEGAGEAAAGAPDITPPMADVTDYVTDVTEVTGEAAPEAEIEPSPGEGEAAGALLEAEGVRLDAPWPLEAEPLRALFRTEAPLLQAPDDDCVYVRAPLPDGSGYPYVAAGLRILGGALAAVRYALPAAWSEEPPAGLEDCAWVGDENRGWWVSEISLEG